MDNMPDPIQLNVNAIEEGEFPMGSEDDRPGEGGISHDGDVTSSEEEEDDNEVNRSILIGGVDEPVAGSSGVNNITRCDNDVDSNADTVSVAPSVTDSVIAFNPKHAKDVKQMIAEQEFKRLKGNPAFDTYVKKLIAAEVNAEKVTPVQRKSDKHSNHTKGRSIKSPSDTTIYAPALRQVSDSPTGNFIAELNNANDAVNQCTKQGSQINEDNMSEQIIKFIEGPHVQVDARRDDNSQRIKSDDNMANNQQHQDEFSSQADEGKRKANHMLVQAERFKAVVNNPPGNDSNFVDPEVDEEQFKQNSTNINAPHVAQNYQVQGDIDDEFFHVTCHVDSTLCAKIEQGGFVELEKLLPKTKRVNDNKMDLVFKDGHSYFVPAQNDDRITGIRKWEQAFRIYAAIYSQANPARSAEIWQYVHVINTAAGSYTWENVSNYDYTFRQLMAQYPQCSWAKLNLQMWSISMRDPIQKMYGPHNNSQSNYQVGAQQNRNNNATRTQTAISATTANTQGKKKPNYCWAFNKGVCKFGQKCKFVNRCSYCDQANHGIYCCLKQLKETMWVVLEQTYKIN